MTVSLWLLAGVLAGVLGIAGSTLAVSKVITRGGYPDWAWRVGLAAAVTVTAAMAAGAVSTFARGPAAQPARPGPNVGIVGWILIAAIMMLTTLRAAWALARLRGHLRATAP